MDALVASKAAHYVSGGAMQEGRRVWMLLKLDAGEIRVKGDDVAHPYLFGGNGHDGWHGIEFGLTSTFIVCMNTYRRAITKAAAEGLYSKLRHTKNVGLKIEEVRQMLGVIVEPFKELEVQANRLADCKINSTQLDVFLESLGFDPDAEKGAAKEKYNLLVNSFENAPGQHLVARKGTLWGAFNAVTYYVDHGKTYKTETAKENAIIGGDGEALKAKAMRSAMAMAENL